MHITKGMRILQQRARALPVPLIGLFYVLPLRPHDSTYLLGLTGRSPASRCCCNPAEDRRHRTSGEATQGKWEPQ